MTDITKKRTNPDRDISGQKMEWHLDRKHLARVLSFKRYAKPIYGIFSKPPVPTLGNGISHTITPEGIKIPR